MAVEHQAVMMGRVPVDGLGQIIHARGPELLAKDFDHAPYRLLGPLARPDILEQYVVMEESIRATGQSLQEPKRQRVSQVASLVAPLAQNVAEFAIVCPCASFSVLLGDF